MGMFKGRRMGFKGFRGFGFRHRFRYGQRRW